MNEVDASGKVVRLTELNAAASEAPQSSTQPKLPVIAEASQSAEVQDTKAPEQSPAATDGASETASTPASVVQPDWAGAVKGFEDVLPSDSYSALFSFYESIALFEAARAGAAMMIYLSSTMSCLTWKNNCLVLYVHFTA